MAQKVQVILVDDVDGGPADETINFSLDGVNYEVDLSSAHAKELRQSFETWTAVARKTSNRRSASRGRGQDTAKIRAWAKQNGYAVSERGRISAEVREAYAKAN
ncbi:Lsr2 family protein [Demequina sp. B12]|uniref:histone-like nucleoid-structuring protein Lsr2 n=1 Tax=Demequina sp. B12 TaxID=2992757 RepID=UPI00237BA7DD|nr:Lsr2 family protein [Demequina sp. B12]MDE0573692.1 Lsr2 family protein [Demequina sp. B12]